MAPTSIRVAKGDSNKIQGPSIEIVVGSEKKVYSVHEALIRASSTFFDRALAGEWKESAQRTVHLPDDEPKALALYIHWLYCGTLPVFCDEPGLRGNEEYLDLVKAYVLGDKILDIQFQNTAIDAIVEKSRAAAQDGKRWYPVGEAINHAYENTRDSAPIRRLLVDLYVNYGGSWWMDYWEDAATIPQPFLLSLTSRLFDRKDDTTKVIEANDYYSFSKEP